MKKISQDEHAEKYKKCKGDYDKLGKRLAEAIKITLDEREIKTLPIQNRTKDEKSFLEKIERKQYENPFDEIEDICGIRIICYYQSEVEKIVQILEEQFDSQPKENKEENLEANQFGYRSTHLIVKIKDFWKDIPNYRGLNNLKAEIQVRSILMHAWAEIEHKFGYKSEKDIPREFRRDFAGVSALLEIADKEFERLKENLTKYKEEVTESFDKNEYEEVELNRDSLQAFLDKYFPDKIRSSYRIYLLSFLKKQNLSLKDLSVFYKKTKDYLIEIEIEIANIYGELTQYGMILLIIELSVLDIYEDGKSPFENIKPIIEKWQKIIAQDETKKNKKD